MGCAAVQAVNGFIMERSMGGSLLAGTQTSSVLKLQVISSEAMEFQVFIVSHLLNGNS
jgi:hypothetical protein